MLKYDRGDKSGNDKIYIFVKRHYGASPIIRGDY